MTAKMIRYDAKYEQQIQELITKSNGAIELIDDPNLLNDSYYYEHKASLYATLQGIDNGQQKMLEHDEFWREVEEA